MPIHEIDTLVCEGAVFTLEDRLDIQLADGREYEVARLVLAVAHSPGPFPLIPCLARNMASAVGMGGAYPFVRITLTPREDTPIKLRMLSELPTDTARVRAAYNLVAAAVPDSLVGILKDVRSEQLPLEDLTAYEPAAIARQLCALQRSVENLSGRKTQFSLK